MPSKEFLGKLSESFAVRAISTLGLTIFTGLMVSNWQSSLSAYNAQKKQTTVAQSVVTPSTPSDSTLKAIANPAAKATEVSEVAQSTSTAPPISEKVAEINDPETLKSLNQKLYEKIDQNWQGNPTFETNLVYRVTVKPDGAIASYESINQTANDYIQQTPIPKLSDSELTESTNISEEPVAPFLVVLTPNGSLEVSHWIAKQ